MAYLTCGIDVAAKCERPAVREMNPEAYCGEMVGMPGPSGNGKTRLLSALPGHSSAGCRLHARRRHRRPEHGQNIFCEAFNHACHEYACDARREEIAHRVAWAAVKRVYVKVGTEWVLLLP